MPRSGQRHAPEALGPGGSIARGTRRGQRRAAVLEARVAELEAQLYRVSPSDLVALRCAGALPERARPWADLAAGTIRRLRLAAEGEPGTEGYRPLSEQRVAFLETAERLLLLGTCEMARALQADDGESAGRAGTLLGKFAALVRDAIGLEPRELLVPSLPAYLRQRQAAQARAGGPNGAGPDAQDPEAGARRTSEARPVTGVTPAVGSGELEDVEP